MAQRVAKFKYQNLTTPAKKGLTLIWPVYWTHTLLVIHKQNIYGLYE